MLFFNTIPGILSETLRYSTFQKMENEVKTVIKTDIKDPLRNFKGIGVHFKFLLDKSG